MSELLADPSSLPLESTPVAVGNGEVELEVLGGGRGSGGLVVNCCRGEAVMLLSALMVSLLVQG